VRVILHCDLNNFFANVEVLKNPELRGLPIAVCGDAQQRHGIVLAKCEIAKRAGIKTGMTIWQAKQLRPDVIIVGTRHADYDYYSKIVQNIYYRYTDLVEPFGIDECWLDLTNTPALRAANGDAKKVADELRAVVFKEVGLTISVGVSWNKTFAKIGSDIKKPDATTVITSENYKQIVHDLPVREMLFVGKKTAEALHRMNIVTLGDLAAANPEILAGHFGKNAYRMVAAARGEDTDFVHSFDFRREIKSVGNGTTAHRDLVTVRDLDTVVYLLAEHVGYRMRKKGVKGTTVHVSIRNQNLEWIGAQETIRTPTNSAKTIHGAAMKIAAKLLCHKSNLPETNIPPVHSLRIAVSNLTRDTRVQISFLDGDEIKSDKLSKTFDTIRKKYGTQSILYALGHTDEFDLIFETTDE
jgi:DNA polymerase-4